MLARLSTAPMNFAFALRSCSTAVAAVWRGVISDPITKTTPPAVFATIDASVTGMTGGASITIQS